jgi:glycosyltransferase involved in cell wall biosynthesis
MDKGRRIGLVVQRYGANLAGGSEALCRLLAQRLAKHADVEVLTTCGSDYMTWRNEFAPGLERDGDVVVRRFPTDHERDPGRWAQVHQRAMNESGLPLHFYEEWMRVQGPYSSTLLEHLQQEGSRYHLFLFFTYLYATTYFGLPLVRDRAVLIPTAHDEPPIYLPIFDRMFGQARHLLFLSPEEGDFVRRRFCLEWERGELLPMGIDEAPSEIICPRPLQNVSGEGWLIYVGRIDEMKGCREMFEHFTRFRADFPERRVKLAVAGKEVMPVPEHPDIIKLGFVPDAEKRGAVLGALAMVAPSPYESLCIAALESWQLGRPVLANAMCATLVGQCARSRGGLTYNGYAQFRDALKSLLDRPELRDELGRSGQQYVQRRYDWTRVESEYLAIMDRLSIPVAV